MVCFYRRHRKRTPRQSLRPVFSRRHLSQCTFGAQVRGGRPNRESEGTGRRARLLAIDEPGFLPLDADGARPLFQAFADAYERHSVVIATNLELGRWNSAFSDDQMVATMIDHIVHHGRLIQPHGELYRVKNALSTR